MKAIITIDLILYIFIEIGVMFSLLARTAHFVRCVPTISDKCAIFGLSAIPSYTFTFIIYSCILTPESQKLIDPSFCYSILSRALCYSIISIGIEL